MESEQTATKVAECMLEELKLHGKRIEACQFLGAETSKARIAIDHMRVHQPTGNISLLFF